MAPIPGTISHNSTSSSPGTNASLSLTLGTASAGRGLFVCVSGLYNNDAYCGLQIGGSGSGITEVATARAVWASILGNLRCQWFWKADASATGSTTFTATGVGAGSLVSITCYEYTGQESSPIGAVQTKATGGTDQTLSITTTAANSAILHGLYGIVHPGSPASGFTEDVDDNVSGDGQLAWNGHRSATTATSYTVGANITVISGFQGAAGAAIEILEAAAPAASGVGILPGL